MSPLKGLIGASSALLLLQRSKVQNFWAAIQREWGKRERGRSRGTNACLRAIDTREVSVRMSHEYTGSLCTSAATVHAHPWLQRPGWPGDVDVDKAQVSPGEGQRGCRADADGAPADLQAVTLKRLPHPPASQTRYSPAETRLTGQVHPPAYRPITKMPVSFRMLNCLTQSPLTTVQQGCMSVAATDCSRFLQCLHMLSAKLLHAFPS